MFITNLDAILKKRKMTGAELSKILNLSSGTYSHWKSGKIPNGETLKKIADVLDVTTDWLLERTDNTENEAEIISFYRKADDRGKEMIYNTAKLAAIQSTPVEFNDNTSKNQQMKPFA